LLGAVKHPRNKRSRKAGQGCYKTKLLQLDQSRFRFSTPSQTNLCWSCKQPPAPHLKKMSTLVSAWTQHSEADPRPQLECEHKAPPRPTGLRFQPSTTSPVRCLCQAGPLARFLPWHQGQTDRQRQRGAGCAARLLPCRGTRARALLGLVPTGQGGQDRDSPCTPQSAPHGGQGSSSGVRGVLQLWRTGSVSRPEEPLQVGLICSRRLPLSPVSPGRDPSSHNRPN